RRQSKDRAPHRRVPVVVSVFDASVRGTRVCRLGNVLERYCPRRNATQFRTIEVRGQREEPGGEDRILAPLSEPAVGAQEGLLGHIFGATTIVAEAVSQINQRTLPAPDDPFKGGN